MLLIVFGAGASYDSAVMWPPDDNDRPGWLSRGPGNPSLVEASRPPLTDALFNYPAIEVPAAASGVEWVRMNRHDKSVEQTLRALQIAATRSAILRQKLLALRFYLHSAISKAERGWTHHVTNYDALLAAVESGGFDKVCLLTFNYDTFLDQALARHLGINVLPEGCWHRHYALVRCHGSLNWAYEVLDEQINVPDFTEQQMCTRLCTAEPLTLSPLRMFGSNANPPKGHGKLLVPAIAIPAEPKSEFICPKEHVEILEEHIPQFTKVLLIGWKGVEEHVRRALSGLRADVRGLVVSGSEDESKMIIGDLGFPGTFTAAAGGFTRSLYITNEIQRFIES
jgi:hypothetical protein